MAAQVTVGVVVLVCGLGLFLSSWRVDDPVAAVVTLFGRALVAGGLLLLIPAAFGYTVDLGVALLAWLVTLSLVTLLDLKRWRL